MPRLTLVASLVALAALVTAVRPHATAPPKADVPASTGHRPVKLAVMLVFDQMRGDYVDKWRPLFGTRGFQRIQKDGAWFINCYYPYASTITGPGHSALLSGATLDKTGIIGNDWYDRKAAATVYCAGSDRYEIVPNPKSATRSKSVGNPDRMMAETVADVLKRETKGQGKVFGLSLKDRAAILPAGKRPDGAFWFNGKFVTSTYYTDTLPKWVENFNNSHVADRWFGLDWVRSRPGLNYAQFSGPDDVAAEANSNGLGRTFPHNLTGGKVKLQKEYYDALVATPMGNELLLAFAKKCIAEESLGQDDVPDLLTISFSSNDLIGHTFGPDSQEVLDVTLRSDEVVGDLLDYLDKVVGPGNYSVCISADHGVGSMPEVAAKNIPEAKDATRVNSPKLIAGMEAHLEKTFGKADVLPPNASKETKEKKVGLWLESLMAPWVYLNLRQVEAKNLKPADVAKSLAEWLEQQPGIEKAYTAEEIATADHPDDILRLVQRSAYPGRSGDVYIVLKPYHLYGDPLKSRGTTHGSPHDYDRHVPLMVYGPGISGGRRTEGVTPQQMALIVSYFLDLPKPKDTTYELPKTLVK